MSDLIALARMIYEAADPYLDIAGVLLFVAVPTMLWSMFRLVDQIAELERPECYCCRMGPGQPLLTCAFHRQQERERRDAQGSANRGRDRSLAVGLSSSGDHAAT